jgi:hypothetical protein
MFEGQVASAFAETAWKHEAPVNVVVPPRNQINWFSDALSHVVVGYEALESVIGGNSVEFNAN